jgi:hypothetical protein
MADIKNSHEKELLGIITRILKARENTDNNFILAIFNEDGKFVNVNNDFNFSKYKGKIYVWFNYQWFIKENFYEEISDSLITRAIKKYVESGILAKETKGKYGGGRKMYLAFGDYYEWYSQVATFEGNRMIRDRHHGNILLNDEEYNAVVKKLKEMGFDGTIQIFRSIDCISDYINTVNTEIENLCGYILNALEKYPEEVLDTAIILG